MAFTAGMSLVEINKQQAAIIKELREQLAEPQPNQPALEAPSQSALEQENGDLQRHNEALREQLAAQRAYSKLDIRRDMLTCMSEGLKDFRKRNQDSLDVRDTMAIMQLALLSGGAEEFCNVFGEVVHFNFQEHDITLENVPIATGTPVRVLQKGYKYQGKQTGDFILVKAVVELV